MSPIAKVKAYAPFSAVSLSKLQTAHGYSRVFFISTDGENFKRFDMLQYRPGLNDDLLDCYNGNFSDFDASEAIAYTGSTKV